MANKNARRLRKNMTVDEQMLWDELRHLRKQGFHFRKQAPIDRFIVDFVCFSKRLVIEVDGVQHTTTEGRRKDAARDAYLRSQGFNVLRFTNGEVTETPEGVVLEIMAALGMIERPPATWTHWIPPPLSPPRKGEGNPPTAYVAPDADDQSLNVGSNAKS